MEIKVGFISDTHTMHEAWLDNLKYGHWGYELEQQWNDMDLLIFAGDCSGRGSKADVDSFMHWFNLQPGVKVMIGGNHDYFFDVPFLERKYRHSWKKSPQEELDEILAKYPDINYLDDSGVELFGLKIWGSPISPWFHDWAFNRLRDTPHMDDYVEPYADINKYIKPHWDMIPLDTDIVVTHGPPYGHGDSLAMKFRRGNESRVGCIDLMDRLRKVKPKVSVFGHIHEGYGVTENEHTTFINASCLNENYKPVNAPTFLTLTVNE